MKVLIFYGSLAEFYKYLPEGDIPTIVDLAIKDDDERRRLKVKVPGQNEDEEEPLYYEHVVGYADDFPSLSESTIESFVGFIFRFDIDNLYLQNPPDSIAKHIEELTTIECNIKRQKYKALDLRKLKIIRSGFPKKILGQEHAGQQIIGTLYDVAKKRYNKPCVMLFYGSTGVGKTETAKYIADILKEKLFRKQFSMLHSEEFTAYLFGGKHNQNSFAKELLERESNVILLDEFDKPHPVFYSAFYQLFDEGVFSDKNYTLKMDNAIIICTSNFQSESQIREQLGDPIFSRFDAVIQFNDLSIDSVKELIQREYSKQYSALEKKEKEIVEEADLLNKLLAAAEKLRNARQIKRVVREAISGSLINALL